MKLICFLASRVLNRAKQKFIDLLELSVSCFHMLSCNSYMSMISGTHIRVCDRGVCMDSHWWHSLNLLIWNDISCLCSVGSRHANGTPLLLPHLEEGCTVLGSRSSVAPGHPLLASKDSVWFILWASWMPADHSVVWGLMLPVTNLEFQTTGRNTEILVPLWFGVLMLTQRTGADGTMWAERHRQGITCQSALQQAARLTYIQIVEKNCLSWHPGI